MNIDFSADATFSAYVLLLMFSGIVMVVMASPVVKRSTLPLRLLNGVLGVAFFGYGFYLTFFFQGGSYFIVFKAFVLPVVLLFRTIQRARALRSLRRADAAAEPIAG